MYQPVYHPTVAKKLKRIHPNDRKRILAKLRSLAKNPRDQALDVKKLANTENTYRLRTGDLRAIFEIAEEERIIYIWDIDYRGSIY